MQTVMASHFIRDIPLKVLHRRSGDERVTLLQACYDNPLFEEDAKAYRGNNASSNQDPRAQKGAKDYMHCRPPPPHEQVNFKSPKSTRRRQIWIIAFVILAVAVLAVIVGLLVHFLKEDKTSQPIRTTSSPVISRTDMLKGSLKVIDGPFSTYTKDYEDKNSDDYKYFAQSFRYKMRSIFRSSDMKDLYNDTTILQLRPGVRVNFVIVLRFPVDVTTQFLNRVTTLIISGMADSIMSVDASSVNIFVEVPMSTSTARTVSPSDKCELLTFPSCVNETQYHQTAFPNSLGDLTQDQVMFRLPKSGMFFNIHCHGYSVDFFCSAYTPECYNGQPIPPCRDYCEDVRMKCEGRYPHNTSFPVDCSILPQSNNPTVCRRNPYTPGKCLDVKLDRCREIGFNRTSFPNTIGNIAESKAVDDMVRLIQGIQIATHCFKHSLLFACATYMPKCSGTEQVPNHFIPPCRSLCQAYKDRCEIFLQIFYEPWPEALNCSTLPESPDERVCIGYDQAHEPPEIGGCKPGDMRCDNTTCISPSWVCDGYQDCEDNADEVHCASCGPSQYRCSPVSMLCIDKATVCDGRANCYEAVDEAECVRLGTGPDQRLLQIYNPQVDEWEAVCADGWSNTFSDIVCNQLGYKSSFSTIFELHHTPASVVLTNLSDGANPTKIQSYLQRSSFCSNNKRVKLFCQKPICGTRPAVYTEPRRIVGGDEVKPGTWPWIASLHGGSAGKFFCGASVLNEEWILTAAHCIGGGGRSSFNWTIKAGHTRRMIYSRTRQIRQGKLFFLHPNYNPKTVDNDIAMIKLSEPLIFNNYLRPVCLPKQGYVTALGVRCIAAGWGKDNEYAMDYQRAIRQVPLDIASWEACKAAVDMSERPVPYRLTHNMMCAGGTRGHDACAGDSGGPFVCRKENTTDDWYQAGIVSWGIGCAIPNAPGIYTKLPNYIDWIKAVIANNTDP